MRDWSDYSITFYPVPLKLTKEKPRIALYGCFQVGKSTLINCLLNRYAALTGNGLATTSLTARYRYGNKRLRYMRRNGEKADITTEQLHNLSSLDDIFPDKSFFTLEAHEPAEILNLCDLADTPGFQANSSDTDTSFAILKSVNYCLFVMPNRQLWDVEKDLLKRLYESGLPVSVIMNCIEGRGTPKWIPLLNEEILAENKAALSSAGIKTLPLGGEDIFACNALFYWSQQEDFDKSKAYIEEADTMAEQINFLLAMRGEDTSRENILALSRIPHLIDCLKARIEKYDSLTHIWR